MGISLCVFTMIVHLLVPLKSLPIFGEAEGVRKAKIIFYASAAIGIFISDTILFIYLIVGIKFYMKKVSRGFVFVYTIIFLSMI
jgi:hypothetical protein